MSEREHATAARQSSLASSLATFSTGLPAAAFASAAVALVLCSWMLWDSRDFCLDDAWIHLSYAKSLKLGDGFAYNPGDHATGFSSPLWALTLALWPWGDDPVHAVKWLGAGLHALTCCGVVCLTHRLAEPEPGAARRAGHKDPALLRAWAAGLLVACDPFMLFSATSGMEVPLTAALLAWTAYCTVSGLRALSCVLGAACVWARPECLFFLFAWSALRWRTSQRSADWLPALGAAFALGTWAAYCQLVSGYPWPNTYYAKRTAHAWQGVLYFAAQVLPQHAWAVSLTGLWLLARALRRGGEARALLLAYLVTAVAISASRDLPLGLMFYNSRYFAIIGALPIVAAMVALPTRRSAQALVLVPIMLATLYLVPRARAVQRAQERDITTLHTQPAQWLARKVPANARVAVEGAGTTRFFLPRSVRVLDVLGLNDAAVVHAKDKLAGFCTTLRERPTHVLLPDDHIAGYQQTMRLALLKQFVDEDYAMSLLHSVRHVYAARVLGLSPLAHQLCRLSAAPAPRDP